LWQISSRTGSGAVAMRAWCRWPDRRSTGMPINDAAPVTAQATGAGVHRRSPGSASAAAAAHARRHLVPCLLRVVELVVAERLLHRADALLHLLGAVLLTVLAHPFDEPGHALEPLRLELVELFLGHLGELLHRLIETTAPATAALALATCACASTLAT